MQLLTCYSLNYSDVTIRSYEQRLNCKCQTETECCQKSKTRFKLQMSDSPPPPPQLDCNPLTEGFIYSPLHPHRSDFIEEGIKANKPKKNEKDLISENFLSLDLGRKTASER